MRGGSRKAQGGVLNIKEIEYKKGLWTSEEDALLMDYMKVHGKGKWNRIPHLTGLKRCGKSCRLRWMNYLSPSIKLGDFSPDEDDLIIRLHNLLGNRWSLIAGRVPGRTDNQVKNYWNTHLSKKLGIKKGKSKSVKATTLKPRFSIDKVGVSSNAIPSSDHSEGGPIEEVNGVEDVAKSSSMEISSREEVSLTENNNSESSLLFFGEDDSLIVDTRSLLDFLSEYSLDHTWNTKL